MKNGDVISLKDFKLLREKLSSSTIKRSKYNSKKITFDDITFDSKAEGYRYIELKLLERLGEIQSLKLQVPFDLIVNDCLICKYKADFMYMQDNKLIVEDVKGVRTKEYILKKKLMKAIYNIDIFEYLKGKKK